jgi:hypothetical protein
MKSSSTQTGAASRSWFRATTSCRAAPLATSPARPVVKGIQMERYFALLDGEPGAYGVAFSDCPG